MVAQNALWCAECFGEFFELAVDDLAVGLLNGNQRQHVHVLVLKWTTQLAKVFLAYA